MDLIKKFSGARHKALGDFIHQMESVRTKTNHCIINPMPTEYNWMGVHQAGLSLFGENCCNIPQSFSNSVFSTVELQQVAEAVKNLKFESLLLNGYPPYFNVLADHLYKISNGSIKTGVVHHGFPSELSNNPLMLDAFQSLIQRLQSRVIHKFASAKRGFALTLNEMFPGRCFEIIYRNYLPLSNLQAEKNIQNPHIGVFVSNSFRKNFHTQVLAASLVKDATIHVLDKKEISYLEGKVKVVEHGSQPHDNFLRRLGEMTINLHVTLSEASGGQVFTESLSQGVPCLTSHTHSYLDYDSFLYDMLIVPGFDDSYFIFQQIQKVLENYDAVSQKLIPYSLRMNELAEEKLKAFMNA